jgi:hypothetical protein
MVDENILLYNIEAEQKSLNNRRVRQPYHDSFGIIHDPIHQVHQNLSELDHI